MIIKDFIRQMCIPLENSAYFGDCDSVNSKPEYNKGLMQDCGNSSADALELPQSCSKPLVNPPQHGSDGTHLQSIPAQQFRRLHLAWSGPSLDGSTSPGCTELPQIAEGLIKSPPLLCQ